MPDPGTALIPDGTSMTGVVSSLERIAPRESALDRFVRVLAEVVPG